MQNPWQIPLNEAIVLRGTDPEAALAGFLTLVNQYPDIADIHYHTAWCHDRLGLEREAIPFYERALALGLSGEDRAGAYLGLGSTYRCLGEYDKALAVLERGVHEFPDDRGLQVFLAMARYNTGQTKAAVSQLLTMLTETTSDAGIKGYERAIRLYTEDLDRTWP